MTVLLADLEQLETAGQGGDLPEHPVVRVLEFEDKGRLAVGRPHPGFLATLRQVE